MSSAIQLPRQNLIIGGNFDTNPWQLGTSFAGITGGSPTTITADRFKTLVQAAGTGIFTIAKTADAPTVAQAGIFTQNCLSMTVTTADAAIAATDYYLLYTGIEGYDFAQIAQTGFTISFWHKHTLTGLHSICLSNSGQNRSYVVNYTQTTTNTWEYFSAIISASPSAGTWNYTNGLGLYLFLPFAVGANVQGAANQIWDAATYLGSSDQVNNMGTNGNIMKFALMQIRPGTQIQPWETRTERDELALCQRYFFKSFIQGTAPAQNVGVNTGECTAAVGSPAATLNSISIQFPVTMRTIPTITTYSPGAASAEVYNITAAAVHTATAAGAEGDRGIYVTSTGNAGGTIVQVQGIHVTAAAEL